MSSARTKGYPHTHLTAPVVDHILDRLKRTPGLADGYWVEAGSFIGNSAIVAVKRIQQAGLASFMPFVAIDPFTGDVNMWAWHVRRKKKRQFDFLKMSDRDGRIRIYETFLANVVWSSALETLAPAPSAFGAGRVSCTPSLPGILWRHQHSSSRPPPVRARYP